jgi:hypothetical protein
MGAVPVIVFFLRLLDSVGSDDAAEKFAASACKVTEVVSGGYFSANNYTRYHILHSKNNF